MIVNSISHGKSTTCMFLLSASGFPVIIKFQPATCTLQKRPAEGVEDMNCGRQFPVRGCGVILPGKIEVLGKRFPTFWGPVSML